uniref:Ig-like domain-containing protein n=1 Tax=Astatotilapia calliptera TaxID=8154 RepID=A0A3P8NGN9_ASTCA
KQTTPYHQIFDTKNVAVEENVTLNCFRDRLWHSTNLFWIRLVSQSFPEIVGSTMSYDSPIIENIHHITTKQEPGTFVLHINGAQLSDTAVYYCIKVRQRKMTFLKGTFLQVKGPDPGITGVTQDSLSNPVHPGDPVTLQCSVLSNSENRTCTEDHSVYWYRTKPDESHPSLMYSQGNNSYDCERSPEAASQQKCVYSFSRNVSSSDTGTYYCAVATCGEILFGNGTKLNIEGKNFLLTTMDLDEPDGKIKPAVFNDSLQIHEDSLTYAAPTFIKRNTRKAERRNTRAKETMCIYSDVRAFECGKSEA